MNLWVKIYSALLDFFNDLPLALRGLILGPLVLVILINTGQWVDHKYPVKPSIQISEQRIQHPNYHGIAVRALREFSLLSTAQRVSLLQNLNDNMSSVSEWLIALDQSNYQMLCLGESHTESTRQFLAEAIFQSHRFDTLYLEATDKRLNEIKQRLLDERLYFPMLNADIVKLLHSVKSYNPDISLQPIEINQQQVYSQRNSHKSREDFIMDNFWRNYRPKSRNIVLLGAMHCSDSKPWFYFKMKQQLAQNNIQRINNVRVLAEHEEGAIESFVYFLDEIGVAHQDFVINTTEIPAEIQQWFPLAAQFILKPFQSVIVYR